MFVKMGLGFVVFLLKNIPSFIITVVTTRSKPIKKKLLTRCFSQPKTFCFGVDQNKQHGKKPQQNSINPSNSNGQQFPTFITSGSSGSRHVHAERRYRPRSGGAGRGLRNCRPVIQDNVTRHNGPLWALDVTQPL